MAADNNSIPQAQADVLDSSGKRFTLPWFQFFGALEGLRRLVSETGAAGLQSVNNLADVADASTAFANIKQSASGTTTGAVQQAQPTAWVHTVTKVADISARFLCRAQTSGTITSTYTDCLSGTCTVRWAINGVAVGTATNSVSSTAQTRTHSAANTFVAGDIITYTITSNATCLEALLQANVTLDLAA